jgi:hypothetical protein
VTAPSPHGSHKDLQRPLHQWNGPVHLRVRRQLAPPAHQGRCGSPSDSRARVPRRAAGPGAPDREGHIWVDATVISMSNLRFEQGWIGSTIINLTN